jgi:hypothetical protein
VKQACSFVILGELERVGCFCEKCFVRVHHSTLTLNSCFFLFLSSSGPMASDIVSTTSRVMKKIDPVRLLESQMASLRQSYENWVDDEPELETDRPTEEEMADFEEAEQKHKEQFAELENRASQFSQLLGVFGKLSDSRLGPALDGFVREGLRFSFSNTDSNGDDTLVLGGRLTFLNLLAKYSSWVKKNKGSKAALQKYVNELEREMRKHEECELLRSYFSCPVLIRPLLHYHLHLITKFQHSRRSPRGGLGSSCYVSPECWSQQEHFQVQ